MKLSKKSEYALLALINLAEHFEAGLMTIEEIAQHKNIPKKYLEQILILLKNAGFLKSIRGMSGGYKLAKPPEKISLAEIIRLVDGPLAPVGSVSQYFYEPSPVENEPKLLAVLKDIRDYIAEKMEHTTLADLLCKPREK